MKSLLVLVSVFIIATSLTLPSQKSDFAWEQFKSSYKKAYGTAEDEQMRYEVFLKRLEETEEHNVKYRLGLSKYKMGINKFSDWTREEISSFTNEDLLIEDYPEHINRTIFHAPHGVKLPDSVDWRLEGAVTDVKDQRHCNACWSFSATGALESILKIKKDKLISLSEQNLMDCYSWTRKGCMGGFKEKAFFYVMTNGIESEEDYPFTEKKQECEFDFNKSVMSIEDYVEVNIGDEEALQAAVAQQPVSVAVDAKNFRHYHSGIFDDEDCSSTILNHAVLVVGYGTADDVDYWIIKNSWGADWGEDGYFRLIRNQGNRCGIATRASFPVSPFITTR